jgi:hypothetical protein
MKTNDNTLQVKAWHVFYKQRQRAGVEYTREEFVAWYVKHMRKTKLKRPEVGRKNHALPYSFKNIFLQEKSDNIKERNARLGNPGRKHKKVEAVFIQGETKTSVVYASKVEAARFLNISEKTVYNHCNKKFKTRFKYGKNVKSNPMMTRVVLKWKS